MCTATSSSRRLERRARKVPKRKQKLRVQKTGPRTEGERKGEKAEEGTRRQGQEAGERVSTNRDDIRVVIKQAGKRSLNEKSSVPKTVFFRRPWSVNRLL